MRIETPLARTRGLGAAKEGVNHWWAQRLTAIILVPLTLWFVASLWWLVVGGADRAALVDWLRGPVAAILMILFVGATFYHAKLGLQVVIEDYVQTRWLKTVMLVMMTLGCIVLGLASTFAVIKLALGG